MHQVSWTLNTAFQEFLLKSLTQQIDSRIEVVLKRDGKGDTHLSNKEKILTERLQLAYAKRVSGCQETSKLDFPTSQPMTARLSIIERNPDLNMWNPILATGINRKRSHDWVNFLEVIKCGSNNPKRRSCCNMSQEDDQMKSASVDPPLVLGDANIARSESFVNQLLHGVEIYSSLASDFDPLAVCDIEDVNLDMGFPNSNGEVNFTAELLESGRIVRQTMTLEKMFAKFYYDFNFFCMGAFSGSGKARIEELSIELKIRIFLSGTDVELEDLTVLRIGRMQVEKLNGTWALFKWIVRRNLQKWLNKEATKESLFVPLRPIVLSHLKRVLAAET